MITFLVIWLSIGLLWAMACLAAGWWNGKDFTVKDWYMPLIVFVTGPSTLVILLWQIMIKPLPKPTILIKGRQKKDKP